jgi:hypothetical protein
MGATAIEQALNAILLLVTFIITYKKYSSGYPSDVPIFKQGKAK